MNKKFFIGIDSDGTVFDSMNIKHYEAFIPAFISVWNLEDHKQLITEIEARINLLSNTRGINRFPGLLLLIKELEKHGIKFEDTTAFEDYVKTSKTYSNKSLEEYMLIHKDPLLDKVLAWSYLADKLFKKAVTGLKPFKGVLESFQKANEFADIYSISSASKSSLLNDWEKAGLTPYVKELLSQENGSKQNQIELKISRYDKKNMLLLGDAPSDLKAAQNLGIWFFPICPGQEKKSWEEFLLVGLDKLFNGTFDEQYQNKLISNFNICLLGGSGE